MTSASPPPAALAQLRIDRARLQRRIDDLASVGAADGGGVSRLALSDADRAGRDLVVTWMRDLGLAVTIDAIGNIVGTRPGRHDGAPVMCGSHIDSVRSGGRLDGTLGVLAGLELIETLEVAGVVTDRPLAVAVFTNEEGSRFPPDMMGSLVYAGALPVEEALGASSFDGTTVGAELARIGYEGAAPVPAPPPHAFVELHIEQGPVLEAEGVTVGAVTGVQGISWTEIVVDGQANHAGTTPMAMRRDAGLAAARIAVFVRALAEELGPPQVGTVGRLDLRPDLVNVVASSATLTVDLRNTVDEVLVEAERRLDRFCAETAADEGVALRSRRTARFAPVEFDPGLVDLVEQTAAGLGHTVRRLPSGAGHDAQILAGVCPAAMIFVPSRDGISHNPAEHTDADDLGAGADVLLQTVLALAAGDGPQVGRSAP